MISFQKSGFPFIQTFVLLIHFLQVMFAKCGYMNGVPAMWIPCSSLYMFGLIFGLCLFSEYLDLNSTVSLLPQEMTSQRRPEGRSSLCFITLSSDNADRYYLFAQCLHDTTSNHISHVTTSNHTSCCHLTTPTQLAYQAESQPNKPSTVKHCWCFQCQSSTSGSLHQP